MRWRQGLWWAGLTVGWMGVAVAAGGSVPWSYHGSTGPERWGQLSREYWFCGQGKNQSPVDIRRETVLRTDLRPLEFSYEAPLPLTVRYNGHAVEIPVSGKYQVRAEGQTYSLIHIHFHTPSEHLDGGNRYPLEAHLVHRNEHGELLVVGVWFRRGEEEHPALAAISALLPPPEPQAAGQRSSARRAPLQWSKSGGTIDVRTLLPRSEGFFRYNGSLTTPPCTEGVRWYVMQEAVPASEAQLKRLHEVMKDNARPVQPLGARRILE